MGPSRICICGDGELGKGVNFEGLAAATIFFDTSEESQLKAMQVMTSTFTFISFFTYNFSMIIDIALQIDLVLTL